MWPASCAETAAQCREPDANGVQRIFACRVAHGVYVEGTNDQIVPSVREGDMLYDSTVNRVGNPSIFVMYKDDQAYPEYLISYRLPGGRGM